MYVLRNGCTWRAMPHDLPPWGTVWWYFREWRQDGTWERVHEALRPKVRKAEGGHVPSSPCMSASVILLFRQLSPPLRSAWRTASVVEGQPEGAVFTGTHVRSTHDRPACPQPLTAVATTTLTLRSLVLPGSGKMRPTTSVGVAGSHRPADGSKKPSTTSPAPDRWATPGLLEIPSGRQGPASTRSRPDLVDTPST